MKARAYRSGRTRPAINSLWWATKGRRKPTAIEVDDGSCFISKGSRKYGDREGLRVVYGPPYHPRGRGQPERFHGIVTQELVGRVSFRPLSHFRLEIRAWRAKCTGSRLHGGIGWKTPAEVYVDRKLTSRKRLGKCRGRQDLLKAYRQHLPTIYP